MRDARASSLLAWSYINGDNGVKVDAQKAFEFFAKENLIYAKLLKRRNDPEALLNLPQIIHAATAGQKTSIWL